MLDVLTPVVTEAAAAEGPGKSGTAGGGYILDGFPRTLPQAVAAAELAARLGVSLDAAIYLHAPDAVLTRRLLDRAGQSGRPDDRADVIRHRLLVYAETTGPLVPYYTERGILVAVDAHRTAAAQRDPGLPSGPARLPRPATMCPPRCAVLRDEPVRCARGPGGRTA